RGAGGDDMAGPVAVDVAHGNGAAPSPGAALHVDPGQRRIPSNVDMAFEQRGNLSFVIAEKHVVDRAIVSVKELLQEVPHDGDLGLVDHGAYHDGLLHLFYRARGRGPGAPSPGTEVVKAS